MLNRFLLLLGLVILSLAASASAQQDYTEAVRKLVVMVEADLQGFSSDGAGIVFATNRGRIYIVTANHVVRQTQEGTEAVQAKNIKVKFWQLPGEVFTASLLEPLNTSYDIAVLSLRLDEVGLRATDFPFDLLRGGDIATSEFAISVGRGGGREWVTLIEPFNIIRSQGGYLEIQASGVSPGDSGGGVFNEQGALLGIITSDAPPALRAVKTETLLSELEANRFEISVSRPQLVTEPASESTSPKPEQAPSSESAVTKLQIDGAQASSSFSDSYSLNQALDGDTETYWSTAPDADNVSLEFLFRQPITVARLRVYSPEQPVGQLIRSFTLSTASGETREITLRGLSGWEDITFEPLTADTLTLSPKSFFDVGSPRFVNVYELELYDH